jgi:transposase
VQRLNPERELMRGEVDPQSQMFSYFSPESRVPAEHPLRSIKAHTDQVLKKLSRELEALYAPIGRPSIPPEQLLKGQLLMALYSVRSDRLFCQMLDYNILFRWFLDMSLDDEGLDQSNFSRLRERLVSEDLAQRFFDAIVKIAREQDLLSSEHLTVDGTLIEAWAGAKSFKPKDGPPPPSDGRGGVDFRGSTRTNDTHGSTTDPEAISARKGKGKEAKLCFGGHALMENRNGLCLDIRVSSALESESAATEHARRGQGLSHQGICGVPAPQGHPSAYRADRQPQDPRTGWAHNPARQLLGQPAKAQAGRRNLRLDEILRRLAPHAHARHRSCPVARSSGRCSLQPAAVESPLARHRIGAS